MKRAFVFTLLAGLVVPAGSLLAQAGPPMGGGAPGPQNQPGLAAQGAPAGNSAAAGGAAIFGNQSQGGGQFGGQPGGQPGGQGQLGGPRQFAGGGAPGVQGAPAQGGGIAGGQAIGGQAIGGQAIAAQGGAAIGGQASIVSQETQAPVLSHWQVNRVIKHCLTRHVLDQLGGHQLFEPIVPFTPVGIFPPPPFGDIELLGVHMVSDMAGEQGPLYRVSLKNNSPVPVFSFRVSLIAVLGMFDRSSLVVTAEIKEIAAGGTVDLDIQMPVGVMAIGAQGQGAPFETLVAAVDSFNELSETDELNNVVILTRTDIDVIETAPAAAPAAAAATTTTVTTTTEAAIAPAAGAPAVAPEAAIDADAGPEALAGEAAPAQPMPAVAGAVGALETAQLDNLEQPRVEAPPAPAPEAAPMAPEAPAAPEAGAGQPM